MKKKKTLLIVAVFLVIGALFAIPALADGNGPGLSDEGNMPSCTGPKKENIAGNIFCHSENTAPCKDLFGCD